ncbi:Protein kinase-like domain protein [Beauveria brongniartii RCEF 3172]|uniref:Protein kinase-like domain protein n=1 Tax=Beauveria brongniartii RCEF 3172 TaxID=1081107 RepID=A0A167H1Z6_9HYPO|nr:Protein kinase-like domain protein [Beauveria brongniartii RCEF 3172]
MEYLQHGDLQKHLARPLSEQEAKLITTQIIEGLGFMHENGFTHRDLKPGKNIMVVNPGPKWFVKIADFGISKRRHELSTSLHTLGQGTIGFAAPEAMGIIDAGRSYTSAVDMWSLGAVVYMILTGTVPFSDLQKVLSYCTGKLRFPSGMLDRQSVTGHGQQFIMALMVPDGRQRLTSTTAAKHPWMTQSNHRSAQL